mgnify:CR=1 FL=1
MNKSYTYRLTSSQKRKIWLAKKFRFWPALLWVLLALFVVLGIQTTSKVARLSGVVDYPTLSVSATETGRIESIYVTVGQKIRKDEELVQLKSLEIDYEIAGLQAANEAEARATQRQFFDSMQGINTEIREIKLQQTQDKAELAVLKEENQRLEKLYSQSLVDAEVLAENRERMATLKSAIDIYPEYLLNLEKEKKELEKMGYQSPIGQENHRAMQISILENRAKSLTICANEDGVISKVLKNPGDVVSAGETVLELLGNRVPVVQGFIPISAHRSIQPGDTVYLADRNDLTTIYEGTISNISPSVIGIQDNSFPVVSRMLKGRIFIVESAYAKRWVESEQVSIFLEKPTDSTLNKWLYSLISWLSTVPNF